MVACCMALVTVVIGQTRDEYYYADGQRIYWVEDSTSANIIVANMEHYDAIVSQLEHIFSDEMDEIWYDDEDDNIIVNSRSLVRISKDSLIAFISIDTSDIAFFTYSKRIDSSRIWLRNEIYLLLSDTSYFHSIVLPLADRYRVKSYHFEGRNEYRFVFADEHLMMEFANTVHDFDFVVYSTPDFYSENSLLSVNDSYFGNQWGLHNTGQYQGVFGVDIKALESWEFIQNNVPSIDKSIKVAVVDDGVEPHEDFYYENGVCKVLDGYTANGVGTGRPRPKNRHGQCCAGIIGAVHNDIGVSGVAPYCQIVPFRMRKNFQEETLGFFSNAKIAHVIRKSWEDYYADVISISWVTTRNSKLTYEIQEAVTKGRNGKGCVVVAASGNDNLSIVRYPASLFETISVGAVMQKGYRASFSNYGDALNLVAPGVVISTVDRFGDFGYNSMDTPDDYVDKQYTRLFGGTSAACPHVAGVAALILSVNPNITSNEIRNILMSTAERVNSSVYIYSQDPDHPYGAWNNQMGYGVVNAYKAVRTAFETDLYVRDTISDVGTIPNNTTYMWCSPDIWLEDMNGNVVNNPIGGCNYNVCVKVHNRRNIASTGTDTLILNWVKAGIGTGWFAAWSGESYFNCNGQNVPKGGFITPSEGVVIPSIPAFGERVVKVLWRTPDPVEYEHCSDFGSDLWHFCLLARIHDKNEIVGENIEGYDMADFVTRNNNVAWKNVTFLQETQFFAVVNLSNHSDSTLFCKLRIISHPNNAGEYITDFAKVKLIPDVDLESIWQAENVRMTNIDFHNGEYYVMGANASVSNVSIPNNSDLTLKTVVNFNSGLSPRNDTMEFDIVLYDEIDRPIGGERYIAIKSPNCIINPHAREDQVVFVGGAADLTADYLGEDYEYKWYDISDSLLAEGTNVVVSPDRTQKYTLEVTSLSNGYMATDSVLITVKKGIIAKITPNPASTQIVVDYQLSSSINSAKLEILNSMGIPLIVEPVSSCTNSQSINIQNLTTGQYVVKMLSQTGEVIDAKTLIVQ